MGEVSKGILRMPRELREDDLMSRHQFDAAVLWAVNEIEWLQAELADTQEARRMADMKADAFRCQLIHWAIPYREIGQWYGPDPNPVDNIASKHGWNPLTKSETMTVHYNDKIYRITRL